MAYVQLENPEIIDLASIQKIINVINDHSDYLNVLVNKFGADYIPDRTKEDVQQNFDIATSAIIYGQIVLDPSDESSQKIAPNNDKYYIKRQDFESGISFGVVPRIYLSHDNTFGGQGGQLDIVLSTIDVDTEGFTIRAYRAGSNKNISAKVEINYIAIGIR